MPGKDQKLPNQRNQLEVSTPPQKGYFYFFKTYKYESVFLGCILYATGKEGVV
jgi:hypothetical protein